MGKKEAMGLRASGQIESLDAFLGLGFFLGALKKASKNSHGCETAHS